ncbi:acyl-CoA dehydrogenase family protein [Portibacter lacus]|uniref:Acyl-CoA dehydrogenase n=1 Tax=Portibacter lacus TaxID=1099794 RepID=A0AA37SQ51_9BACT|nr:acyl-CoA dehydrogenase family protein [Portibacter lacus]GLR17199.1 acyl-CoA dehydrogenase [Portibacter lacus]
MESSIAKSKAIKGGAFIVEDQNAQDIYIPEDHNEEQGMFIDMAKDFVGKEWMPVKEEIEKQANQACEKLMDKAGEMGFLGSHIPAEYEGMELDTNTNTHILDVFGPMGSFNTTFAAHTGIGMLPVLYYGTEEQKKKYLPRLISGELKAAYCLTEPSSGSDALSAKTTAKLSDDGKDYIINGQKMWISNAGFANFFVLFAQIDGDKFTGFVVEGKPEGLTLGEEEAKLGIKGSSTRMVFFENMKVPVENLLGEIGKGHLIAFNALNMGRFKLGSMAMGGAKAIIDMATKYANERIQFKVPISSFGAIQYKLAEMTIRNFAVESAVYRVSDLLDRKIAELKDAGVPAGEAKRQAAEEYAIECSIIKVGGSESSDYAVDENVQIHGGIGFSEEAMAARAYRDNRITRIYEGTNEINRLLIVDMLLKKALKGQIDLTGPAWEVQKELKQMPSFDKIEGEFGHEIKAVEGFKKLILLVAGAATKKQMDGELNLKVEQQLLTYVSDMIISTYNAESLLLRVQKLEGKGSDKMNIYKAIMRTYFQDTKLKMDQLCMNAIPQLASGDIQKIFVMGVSRFNKYPLQNVIENRKEIAKSLIEANGYNLFR